MPNPFTKAAKETSDKALSKRITIEGRIVSKLIKHGLASGYKVSLHDGEEWVVKSNTSYSQIMAAAYSSDWDMVRFRDNDKKVIGTVTLIYGNDGYDVISDYSSSDVEAFDTWLKPVTEYATTFEV